MAEERRYSHDEILARLDERTNFLVQQILEIKNNFVTKNEFNPVRNIVYGFTGLILLSVLGALITLAIKK